MQDIIKECKERRIKKGISVKEMAVLTGYSPSNIYHFESGRNNNLTLYTLYRRILWEEV